MSKQEKLLTGKNVVLGIQHLFAMFGATILVASVTGLNPLVTLFSAGVGTLIFHFITKKMVPVFLGSSFAFISALQTLTGWNDGNVTKEGIAAAGGAVIMAGVIYLLFALIVYLFGTDIIKKVFPPVVTGPIIIVIGIHLSPFAIADASANWWVALFVIAVIVITMMFTKGFFKLVPILIGFAAGYVLCYILDLAITTNFVNVAAISESPWLSFKAISEGNFFTLPKFRWDAILLLSPIAIVTVVEHIGDITANGSVVGKDFYKEPGLHRTLIGDGIATMLAGTIGGPPNTTYSENTGVLAVTRNYNPAVLRIAAVFAIILSVFGKFGAMLGAIPTPVKGGMCMILYGMIASVGLRTLINAELDFSHSRNLLIVALILVTGIGISVAGGIPIGNVTLSGVFVAALTGIILNLALPKDI